MAEPAANLAAGLAQTLPAEQLPPLVRKWFGTIEWLASQPLPSGRRIAVVSSRIPRLVNSTDAWLCGLRAALIRLAEPGSVAIIARGAAAQEFLWTGVQRQQTPHIVLECERDAARIESLSRDAHHFDLPCDSSAVSVIPAQTAIDALSKDDSIPLRDRASIAWADDVIVLRLRTGGNMHKLLRRRLEWPGANVLLADLPRLQSQHARAELISLGARPWPVAAENYESASSKLAIASATSASIVQCAPNSPWDYLTHTTRACPGPWPNQSRTDYIESLLDQRDDSDHSAFQTLRRIAQQRRLCASSRAIRGGYEVVSFTEVPLRELPGLRVFRAHRARWDFEPYGLCIKRDALEKRGARTVTYGSVSDWDSLDAVDRPFFQYLRKLDAEATAPGLDWSVEREWRCVGDLDLSELAPQDAFAFVPTHGEARKLLEISPWPVTVLE